MNQPSQSLIPTTSNGLRFWPSEPISWQQSIVRSGLSTDIQERIFLIIRHSRLMRFEKIEVAQDLIAHFEDGLAAGNSEIQLLALFGDAKITAALINQTKKRNRPIMFKILQIFGWTTLALASSYAGLWVYFNSGIPSPTNDFLADLNRGVSDVVESDKAWPVYRPVWTKFGFCEGGGFGKAASDALYVQTDDNERRYVLPTDAKWPSTVAKLEEWTELLDCFREAADKPRLGLELQSDISKYSEQDYRALFPNKTFPATEDSANLNSIGTEIDRSFEDSIVAILLPHIQSFRTAARILSVDVRVAVEQGDTVRAIKNYTAIFAMSSHAADNNILVGGLVGFSVARMGFDSLQEILIEHPDFFSEADLAAIQKTVESLDFRSLISLSGERAMAQDIFQRVYTDDGAGNGRITPAGIKSLHAIIGLAQGQWSNHYPEFGGVVDVAQKMAEPALLLTSATRKQTEESYANIMDLFEDDLARPFWETKHISVDEFIQDNKWKHHVLDLVVPAMPYILNQMHKLIGRQEGVIAAIAAQRFRLIYGHWPDSIEQLATDFVVELPVDIVNGQHLRISLREGAPTFYSVGNDQDDDGGRPQSFTNRDAEIVDENNLQLKQLGDTQKTFDGDWILWPQP